MANTIQHKRSTSAGAVPTTGQLATGELALNLTDKKIYSKDGSGNVVEMSPTVIADASVTVAKISATGTPSSSTYLRGDGSWQAVSGGVTSLNGQTGAITDTNLYAVGSYVTARPMNYTTYSENSTLAGSSLYATTPGAFYGGATDFYVMSTNTMTTNIGGALINTGSWRCTSRAAAPNSSRAFAGVWVRIS